MNKYDTAKTVGIENAFELIKEAMQATLNDMDEVIENKDYSRMDRLTGKSEGLSLAFDIVKMNLPIPTK